MTKSSDNSEHDKLGRVFGSTPFCRLIGDIFCETQDQLHDVSKRLTKLSNSVGDVMMENEDESHQSKEKTDRIRQWQLAKLKCINRELSRLMGETFQTKLSVVDVIERLKMADLERKNDNDLQKSKVRLLKRGKSKPSPRLGNERADNKSDTATRIKRNPADWNVVEEP